MPNAQNTPTQLARHELSSQLPEDRRQVLEMLLAGTTIAETARTAGITRATIYRWLREDPVFQAAYNLWHEELQESCRSRLLAMTEKAAAAVEKALEAGDARLGMKMLKELGLMAQPPKKPTHPALVARQTALDKRRQLASLAGHEKNVSLEELLSE
jgi:transposase-like protein